MVVCFLYAFAVISDFKIFVELLGGNSFFRSSFSYNHSEVGNVEKSEVENEAKEFVVGSGQTEQNPPLEKGEHYKIYLGSCSVIRTVSLCCETVNFN